MTATPTAHACAPSTPADPGFDLRQRQHLQQGVLDWMAALLCATTELHASGDTLNIQRLAELGSWLADDFYDKTALNPVARDGLQHLDTLGVTRVEAQS